MHSLSNVHPIYKKWIHHLIYWSTTVEAVLSCKKNHLGFSFSNETNVTNMFPYRQAIISNTLASDPYRYSAHGL